MEKTAWPKLISTLLPAFYILLDANTAVYTEVQYIRREP